MSFGCSEKNGRANVDALIHNLCIYEDQDEENLGIVLSDVMCCH